MKKYLVSGVIIIVVFFNVAGWAGDAYVLKKTGRVFSELTKLLELNIANPQKAALVFKQYIKKNKASLLSLQRIFELQVKKSANFLSLHPNTIDEFVKKYSPVIKIEAKLQKVILKLKTNSEFAKVLYDFMGLITTSLPQGFAQSVAARLGQIMDDVLKIVKSNSGNPKAAASALNKYVKANSYKLAILRKDIEKESAVIKKDPSKLGDFMKKFAPVIKKGMELQKITAELMKNPDFAKAMGSFQAASSGR